MKKIAGIVIIIVALGLAGYAVFANKPKKQENTVNPTVQSESTNTQTSELPQSSTVTVTYSDSGFSPAEITVAKGTTVNFVNQSSIPLWVASDPHPQHTDYPEFDTMRNRDKYPQMGENYSFTFNKVGTWKYHSHTASGDGTDTTVHPGVVIVKLSKE